MYSTLGCVRRTPAVAAMEAMAGSGCQWLSWVCIAPIAHSFRCQTPLKYWLGHRFDTWHTQRAKTDFQMHSDSSYTQFQCHCERCVLCVSPIAEAVQSLSATAQTETQRVEERTRKSIFNGLVFSCEFTALADVCAANGRPLVAFSTALLSTQFIYNFQLVGSELSYREVAIRQWSRADSALNCEPLTDSGRRRHWSLKPEAMVEFRKSNCPPNACGRRAEEFVIVESGRQSVSWFNPLRYTMALLALVSGLSSVIIILIIAPNDHQFIALVISLFISLVGIIGSLKVDLTLSGLYSALMLLLLAIQCRYYYTEDISVVSLTVPMLGWASITPLSSFARLFLQFMYCIASSAFVYGLWFNAKCEDSSRMSRFVLERI